MTLLTCSHFLYTTNSNGELLNLTNWIISMKMSEKLNESKNQIVATLAFPVKEKISSVRKGSEFQIIWGYSPETYRKVSAFWVGTTWNIGGDRNIELTLEDRGQFQLSRGTLRAISTPATEVAKTKGVEVKGDKKSVPKTKVQSQNTVKELLRENKDSFIKYGFSPQAKVEVVQFAELSKSAQAFFIDTSVGFLDSIKITYKAQKPKEGTAQAVGSAITKEGSVTSPKFSPNQKVVPGTANPANDTDTNFGLYSFCVLDINGKVLSSYNPLSSPYDGTSLLKLFIALVIRKQVSFGVLSLTDKLKADLKEMLDVSTNPPANRLIAAIGGVAKLNAEIKSLGFTDTGFASVYGSEELKPLIDGKVDWVKYKKDADAAGYFERYEDARKSDSIALEQLAKMRKASGFPLKLISSYRSFADQERLYLAKPQTTAPPGYDQHSTGLAFDLVTVSPKVADQPQLQWLAANAITYGFINPYPQNPSGDLGPSPEPWHWLYVGDAESMAVFHDFVTRSKSLGNDPLQGNAKLEALFLSPASRSTDKETNTYELAKAFLMLIKGTDAVTTLAKQALSGSFVGLDGEVRSKLGFTSNNYGAVIEVGDFIISAYGSGPSEENLKKGMRKVYNLVKP